MIWIKQPKIQAFTYIYLMKQYAIIVAGGSGLRMKSSTPKQYLELNGLPILMHTINVFYSTDANIRIILVLPPGDVSYWENLCKKYQFNVPVAMAAGGASRYESVKNGLAQIQEDDAVVAIHDGVRPLVSSDTIVQSFETAALKGNAVTAVQLKDSIRMVKGDKNMPVDRSAYRLIQTPQTFQFRQLREAYEQQYDPVLFTDDASVVEASGKLIYLIEGSYRNIKITTTEDLKIASYFLQAPK